MIGSVLTDLGPRVSHADLTRTTDQTISVTVGHRTGETVAEDHSDLVQIRVAREGRLGWAGGSTSAIASVSDAALASASVGDPVQLFPPAPSPLPDVVTSSPGSMSLGAADLFDQARRLFDRLSRRDWEVEAWAERSAGSVDVGNTRGVMASYDVNLAGLGANVRSARSGAAICRVHRSSVGPPSPTDLEDLVTEVESRFDPPSLEPNHLPRSVRVWFAPLAVRALLAPVLARLVGEQWLEWRDRWPRLDPRLTLADDPLAAGRPGSRPICDDGIASRRIELIDRGVAIQGLLDLTVGSRHRLPSTGHAIRRGYAGPRIGFSNLVMAGGDVSRDRLAGSVGDGLMVADLEFGPAPNPITGVFRVASPWTYQVSGGEVVGRLEGVSLSGDVFELLTQVVSVGSDDVWLGAARIPSLVLDGVGAEAR